jgi:hypothetical protein
VVEVYLPDKVMARIFLFLLVLLLGASCFNEPDCIVTASSAVKIDFKRVEINQTTLVSTVVDATIPFTSVSVSGIDTAFLKNRQLATLTLPIDPRAKKIKYVFDIASTNTTPARKDSIEFSYSAESRVISPTCGAYAFFFDLKVTSTNLDSTRYRVLNTRLLKNTTNVQVFY